MRFGLVTPIRVAPQSNPGCQMITLGIQNLLTKAFPGSEFTRLSMFGWDDLTDEAALACDALILCGNPRYDLGKHHWLYSGLIDRMAEAKKPMYDFWQGAAAHCGSLVQDACDLDRNPRNQKIIEQLRTFKGIITRDDLAQELNEFNNLDSVRLPCSSWWAGEPQDQSPLRSDKWLVLYRQGSDRCKQLVKELSKEYRPLATNEQDRDWCNGLGVDCDMEYDPQKLLDIYKHSKEILSFRLHAAIPAASFGVKVAMIAIDSRAQACDDFDIPWAHYDQEPPKPDFAVAPLSPVRKIQSMIEATL